MDINRPNFYTDRARERDVVESLSKDDLPLFINHPWQYPESKELYLKRFEEDGNTQDTGNTHRF